MKPTFIDRVMTLNDPRKLTARVVARAQLEYLERSFDPAYEGAGHGRRFHGWRATRNGPNVNSQWSLDTLRARHRELVRNNPWCARAKQAVVSHSIGHGISIEFKGGTKGARERANSVWKEWYETTACDATGRHDGYGLQALKLGTVVEAGGVFVRARWRRPSDKLPVPLQLQVLEPDYCDHTRTEILPTGKIIQGVEFDQLGRRVQYWMFREHPTDVGLRDGMPYAVPAEDIAHIYREDRPGQVHGIPWGAPVLLTLKDLDAFEDAYLFRQKLANCFVGAVHDLDVPGLGSANAGKSVLPDSMEPGAMLQLPTGKKITFNTPPQAADYGPFTQDVLYRVAVTYGITFQALTGNLTKVNFTSGRMGNIDMRLNIDQNRWHMLVPQGIEPITKWFLEALELQYGVNTKGLYPVCTPPAYQMLAPQIEVPAEIKAIRAGLTSLPASLRSRGENYDEVTNEIAASNKQLDLLGLVLDSDPRKVTQVGNSSDANPDQNPDKTDASEDN